MTAEQQDLWVKIEKFELNDSSVAFSFTDRLCRENGWMYEYAIRVVNEYRKFIFLMCISSHPLTPSDQVDQVWHLHLLYTESYWIDLCQNTLGKSIHHGPTKGGGNEKEKFTDWYSKTRLLYSDTFGREAPTDIWPSSEIRFGQINFRRVNLDKYWIITKFKERW